MTLRSLIILWGEGLTKSIHLNQDYEQFTEDNISFMPLSAAVFAAKQFYNAQTKVDICLSKVDYY